MANSLMAKDDIASIKMCLAMCVGCEAFDCKHCPMRVEPARLLYLAQSYENVMGGIASMFKEFNE